MEFSYKRAKALGLPVMFGEVADQVDDAYERAIVSEGKAEPEDVATYHYLPPTAQVLTWINQAIGSRR